VRIPKDFSFSPTRVPVYTCLDDPLPLNTSRETANNHVMPVGI